MTTAAQKRRVDAYRNLNDECISVKSREKEDYGLVIDHTQSLVLEDVEFIVREKGRQQVIEEERKNVHAFARGVRIPDEAMEKDASWERVTYNPYEYDSFVYAETEDPIETAEYAIVSVDGVFVPKQP